jgi:hypothetical protein
VLTPDRFSLKLFTLTPGYCRAPLFDEKKRGFVKQNIPLKNTINFLSLTPLSFFPKRGGEFGKFAALYIIFESIITRSKRWSIFYKRYPNYTITIALQ